MHRLHEHDLVGHVLALKDQEIARVPAIAEEDETQVVVGSVDPCTCPFGPVLTPASCVRCASHCQLGSIIGYSPPHGCAGAIVRPYTAAQVISSYDNKKNLLRGTAAVFV